MSLLDIAPIIEQMLLISENVSDLNFSCGQKPQVEINGVLYPASPIGLGKLSAFQTEMIAMALIRDNPDAAHQLATMRTTDLSYAVPGKMPFSRKYLSAAKFVLDRDARYPARDTEL